MIISVTGHRPSKLGGYANKSLLERFACVIVDQARVQVGQGVPLQFITGMSQGWDQAVAKACIVLHVPFIAAVPCHGQERLWPDAAKQEYRLILEHASAVNVLALLYTLGCMQRRNEWMVDNSNMTLALWDGSDGGTANCVSYCERVGHHMQNLWPAWVGFDGKVIRS